MNEPLPKAIVYWHALWRDVTSNFKGFHSGLRLESPELLIEEVVAELEAGGFYTDSIRKDFYNRLNGFAEREPDPVIEASFEVEFAYLRRVFNQTPEAYVLEVAREVKHQLFGSGRYFDEVLALLTDKLCSTKESLREKDRNVVRTLTRNVIVGFLLKGYSLKRIKQIPARLFDLVREHDGKATTLYPKDTERSNYEDEEGEVEWEQYNRALAAEVENLSVRDRLLKMGYYYHLPTEELIYIFPLVGYNGKEENQDYGDVRIYSPGHVELIKDNSPRVIDEHFGRQEENIENYVNVAVKVDCLEDPEGSRLKAVRKAERILDFLGLLVEPREALYIRSHKALVTDSEGGYRGSYTGTPEGDENYAHHFGQDIEVFEVLGWEDSIRGAQEYIYKSPREYSSEERTIAYSLTWHRKAGAASRAEDQLLGYWVAMENLVADMDRGEAAVLSAKEKKEVGKDYFLSQLAPAVLMRKALMSSAYSLHHALSSQIGRNNIPEKIQDEAGLNTGLYKPIEIQPMVECLDKLKGHIESDLLLEQARFVQQLFNDPDAATSFIKDEVARIRNLVEQIYRYRNKVVHYGHYGSVTMEYYAAMAGHVSKALLQRVVHPFNMNGTRVRESLIQSHARLEMLSKRFENGAKLYGVAFEQPGLFS